MKTALTMLLLLGCGGDMMGGELWAECADVVAGGFQPPVVVTPAPPIIGETTYYSATFGEESILPVCTVAESCALQCTATSGALWACVDGSGSTVTVTQGTGATVQSSPFGDDSRYYLDDVTNAAAPSIPTVAALEDIIAGEHTFLFTGFASTRNGETTQYVFNAPTMYLRQESSNLRALWVTETQGSPIAEVVNTSLNGWSMFGARKEGLSSSGTASYDVFNAGLFGTPVTKSGAGGDPVTGSSGTWYVAERSNETLALRGGLESLTVYTTALTDEEIDTLYSKWRGTFRDGVRIVDQQTNARHWVKDSDTEYHAEWAARASVDPRGLYLDRRVAQFWSDTSFDVSSWTSVGTPVITGDNVSGPFDKFLTGTNAGTLEDDASGASEGVQSADAASPAGIYWNASCIVRQGTEDQIRLSILTDGTGSTTCAAADLTASWARYDCTAELGGSPTYVRAQLLVGGVDADTGTVEVAHCQLDDGSFPRRVKENRATPGQEQKRIAADVVNTWWEGDINANSGSIEYVFTMPRDIPDGSGDGPIYWFDWERAAADNHKLFLIRYDDSKGIALRISNNTVDCGVSTSFSGSTILEGDTATPMIFERGKTYAVKGQWDITSATTQTLSLYGNECPSGWESCTATTLLATEADKCVGNYGSGGNAWLNQRYTGGSLTDDIHVNRITARGTPASGGVAPAVDLPEGVHDYQASTSCPAIGDGNVIATWADDGTASQAATSVNSPTCDLVGSDWSVEFADVLPSTQYFTAMVWDDLTQPFTACADFAHTNANNAVTEAFFDNATGTGAGRTQATRDVNGGSPALAAQVYAGTAVVKGTTLFGTQQNRVCWYLNGASSEIRVSGDVTTTTGLNPGTGDLDSLTIGARGGTHSIPFYGKMRRLWFGQGDHRTEAYAWVDDND